MKTTFATTALALLLALLGSCARHPASGSLGKTKPAPSKAKIVAIDHPETCPHCGRRISDPPARNPIYGPAAYEDHTPASGGQGTPLDSAMSPSPQAASTTLPVPQTSPIPAPPVQTIPAAAPKPAPQLSVDVDGSKYYVVVPGDSLWKIAKAFGVKIDDIKSANALEADTVQVGQKLEIPVP
jgi:LysM repeat protein